MLIQQGDTKLSGIPLKKGKFGFPNLRDSPRSEARKPPAGARIYGSLEPVWDKI